MGPQLEVSMLIKTTHKAIKAALYGTVRNCGQELVTNGSENLMIGGNKAYYKGGGWWYLSSYDGGRDRAETLTYIK